MRRFFLGLAQAFIFVFQQGAEEVFVGLALADGDVSSDRHAYAQRRVLAGKSVLRMSVMLHGDELHKLYADTVSKGQMMLRSC